MLAMAFDQYRTSGKKTARPVLKLRPILIFCFFIALGAPNGAAAGPTIPAGYKILDITLSPDHRYGVTVPDLNTPNPQNNVVEVETGRVLAVIEANTGYESANHNSVLPSRWAKDDSLLLWEVDGKWCDTALVLLKLQNGTVLWQLDLLKAGQQAILALTKQARPKRYLAAKEKNRGSGSAYPDGFTVDVVAEGNKDEAKSVALSLPLKIHAYLTSNPKSIEGQEDTDLASRLDAVADRDGKFRVTNFHLGNTPPAPRW
jgi:hypothetical protein